MGTVLITGARAPVAQDLARACRKAGYDTHLADSVPSFAARALRPAFPVHRLPGPRRSFPDFRAAMLRLLDRTGADRVIPTCEEVFWIAEAAARDGYADRVFAPDLDCLRTLHSKHLFIQFAAGLGIATPETQLLEGPVGQTAMALASAGLVFKPEYSRFASHTLIAPSARKLARISPTPGRRWVAQRRIQGDEACSWAAVHSGRVVAFAAYRPRWRQGRAAAYLLESMEAPQILEIAVRIGAATGMTGHLSFDVIVDAENTAFPIECNPRAVSGLHLFDGSAALARAVVEGLACAGPRDGILRHMGPAMALLGLPAAIMQGRTAQLIRDWKRSRDVINREGRPPVALACLADASAFALQALRSQRSAAGATTADIEWDGEPMD